MTRKDFEAIARTIKELKVTNLARICIADDFADMLAKRNPRFKRVVFLEACGVDP